VRYARKHPETQLTVFEIPQIPGYRHESHSAKGIDESLATTVYAIPIAIMNPYLAGGLFADYLVRGRYHLIPKHPQVLSPENSFAVDSCRGRPRTIPQVPGPPGILAQPRSRMQAHRSPALMPALPAVTQPAGESKSQPARNRSKE
jgi:hypothetical protein